MAAIELETIKNNTGVITLTNGEAYVQTGTVILIHKIKLNEMQKILNELIETSKRKDFPEQYKIVIKDRIKDLSETFEDIKENTKQKRAIVLPIIAATMLGTMVSGLIEKAQRADDDEWKERTYMALNDIKYQQYLNNHTVDQLNKHTAAIKEIGREVNNRNETINILNLMELFINSENVVKEIKTMEESLVLATKDIINKKMLQKNETEFIKLNFKRNFGKIMNEMEMFKLLTPEVTFDKDIINYVIHIPQVHKNKYKLMKINTFSHKNKKPIIKNTIVAQNEIITYEIISECKNNGKIHICTEDKLRKITEPCILGAIQNNTQNCKHENTQNTEDEIKLINPNTILVNPLRQITIIDECDKKQHLINMTTIVKLQNCTILINGMKYEEYQIITNHKFKTEMYKLAAEEKRIIDVDHIKHINNTQQNRGNHMQPPKKPNPALFLLIMLTIIITCACTYKRKTYIRLAKGYQSAV